MNGRWILAGAFALVTAFAVAAHAQGERVRSVGGVSYISGGIGDASQQELKAREPDFNLKLVFTLVEGNYLADVNVAITDAAGKVVLEAVAEGPFFLARLPAGQYAVAATYEGVAQSRKVRVNGRLRTEYLRWPSRPGVDFPGPRDGEPAAAAVAAAPEMTVVADGIGEAAQARLKAIENQYNLKLVFTLIEGNYVADVNVAIRDSGGKTVVERFVGGPILLARLPAGSYSVAATYNGSTESRQVKLAGSLRTEYFRWPSKPGMDFPLPPESRREK